MDLIANPRGEKLDRMRDFTYETSQLGNSTATGEKSKSPSVDGSDSDLLVAGQR